MVMSGLGGQGVGRSGAVSVAPLLFMGKVLPKHVKHTPPHLVHGKFEIHIASRTQLEPREKKKRSWAERRNELTRGAKFQERDGSSGESRG